MESEDKSYSHFMPPHRMAVASQLDVLGRPLGLQDSGLSVYYQGHHYLDKTGLWVNNDSNNDDNKNRARTAKTVARI
jgi:hypothetical protein